MLVVYSLVLRCCISCSYCIASNKKRSDDMFANRER
jgi:hypothetical protein